MESAAQPSIQSATQPGSVTKKSLWTGRIFSGLVTAFLLFDAVIHLMKPAPVVEGFAKLGFPIRLAVPLGIIELVCILLYVLPRTSILGAILLTGYLGGAIAIQLPTGNSLFGEVLFPVYVGVIVWGGLYLRDDRLRALVPWRR
ncbi:MAG TPA: DoxX family protein [Verrucomicrobiae bacterium]|nr:DoxX family protein [Verrucomicrobiae bacterium]